MVKKNSNIHWHCVIVVSCLDTLNRFEVNLRGSKHLMIPDEFIQLELSSQTDKVLNSGRLVACMSRVMLDFSLSLACRSVCSTTPILTSIWTISCFSLVKLCRIFTTGAAHIHTSRDTCTMSRSPTTHFNSVHSWGISFTSVRHAAAFLLHLLLHLLQLLTDLKHNGKLVARATICQCQMAR